MFDAGQLPDNVNLGNPLGEKGIQLPFAAPFLWWKNGSKALLATKNIGSGVQYYGGWAISGEDLERTGLPAPMGFTAETWANREGKEYLVAACRWVGFAPIAARSRWFSPDRGQGEGNGHKRLQVHILGVLGSWENDARAFTGYGPVVLTGSGYAGEYIRKALKEFESVTAKARAGLTPNRTLPANFFYASVGTHGPEPETVMVGKAQTSPITPCKQFLPQELTPEYFQACYVGANTVAQMVDWKDQAADWLAAWKDDGAQAPEAETAPEFPPF